MANIRINSLNKFADSLEKKVSWALSALEEIGQFLDRDRGSRRFELSHDERTQIVSALAYVRSQRREGGSDAIQQDRDWVEAESDLDLILTHLRALQSMP
ncbi:hypothetical protein CCP3SC15_490020 [Gammaproteobacteria bacterium]